MSEGLVVGIPYADAPPRGCQFVVDDTFLSVRMCGAPAAWRGCPWCEHHLQIVVHPSVVQQVRHRCRLQGGGLSMASITMFRCEKQNATLSTSGCARMWRKANGGEYRVQPYEAIFHCVGCSIGAGHAGEKVVAVGFSELTRAIGRHCPRCRRLASRLISGRLCISCYNRDREARIGKNAKGNPPALCQQLHTERVLVQEGDAPPRVVAMDRVLNLPEVLIRLARRAKGPMRFSRPMPDIVAIASGNSHPPAEEPQDEEPTSLCRSDAARMVGMRYGDLVMLMEQEDGPPAHREGGRWLIDREAFKAWWVARSPSPQALQAEQVAAA